MDADFLLIRKMKQGEEAAFDVFVRKYYKDILNYCSYHCPDREYAEDITQETFVHFFAKLSLYHYRGKTKNYLYTIAGNLCKDYLKKAREIPLEDTALSEKIKPKERESEDVLDRLTVEWALKQLPEELSEVIMLYYFQELKLTEIADALQIGLPLVKYRLRRAKMQLEERFKEEAFFASEQEMILSYHEFLWGQLKVIQKRWWVFQFLLLMVSWMVLDYVREDAYIQRSMGVTATLFVILIIPEFWKNRACQCMEIEGASYYSLRQIYAARMLLFGIADIFSLTIFCGAASAGLNLGLKELLIQFLFPLSITACICFGTLCSKFAFSETAAIGLCTIWSGIWLFIILNDNVYTKITFPIWVSLFGFALIYLLAAIYRTLLSYKNYWEVPWNGIEI